jgi:hypothetical protein
MEAFDDKKLINLARYHYYNSKNPPVALELFFEYEELSNADRNQLLAFIESNKGGVALSIRQMKKELLSMIGADSEEFKGYQSTVNRAELETIYKFMKENIHKLKS